MIGIEHIWGAVGCATGTCLASITIIINLYLEECSNKRRKANGK